MKQRYVTNWKLTQFIITEVEEEPSTKLVMVTLANYVKSNWSTSVALSTLVNHTGLSRSTVRRVLQSLEEREWIYRLAGGRQHNSSTFIIKEPAEYMEWNTRLYGSQSVHGDSQSVHGARQSVHGEPLKENKKIIKREPASDEVAEAPLLGPARRHAIKAARLGFGGLNSK